MNLSAIETITLLEPNWIQPEFCYLLILLDVYMNWFITISSIEEESIRADPVYRWHGVRAAFD